jgi:hypothetical protein
LKVKKGKTKHSLQCGDYNIKIENAVDCAAKRVRTDSEVQKEFPDGTSTGDRKQNLL